MSHATAPLEEATAPYAQTLRARRKSLGVSMAAAAQAAGMSRASWHRLEKGEPGVAIGLLLAASEALGLQMSLTPPLGSAPQPPSDGRPHLPLEIRLDAYPQLRNLAWQVRDGSHVLAPHEALAMYERNWRHLDREALEPHERRLIRDLGTAFGTGDLDV